MRKVTNFEHYEKEIKGILEQAQAIALINNEPTPCFNTNCVDCELSGSGSNSRAKCYANLFYWLYLEYKEDKFITKVEKGFLESLPGGYIVRDNHGQLYWFESPPSRVDGMWECYSGGDVVRLNFLKSLELPFIKKDGDVYSVESLLELEVR